VPSVIAACAGAIAAGVVESWDHGSHRIAPTVGFVAMFAVPWLVIASAIARGLVHAWRPRDVLASLTDEDGRAPRLAGWVAVVWLATFGIAWVMFQGTWLLFSWTAFKPLVIAFLAPMLAVAAAFVMIALSRPAARLFAWLARQIDRPCRRFVKRSLLRPWLITAGTVVVTVVASVLIWKLLVRARLPTVDFGLAGASGAGLLAMMVAHAGRGRVRAIAGAIIVGLTAIAVVLAAIASPATTLAIWADAPIARRGIESRFVLEDIRANVPADAFALAPRTREHPDLVVITFENVRADRALAKMPVMRGIGDRGARFGWAFSPSNQPRRSIPATLTGVSAPRVRGTFDAWMLRLDPRHVTIAERLRAGGYATAVFACCEEWSRDARTGWSRGFEQVTVDPDGAALARGAIAWLARTDPRPRFVWIHIGDVANWQRGHQPRTEAERLSLYDAALTRADALLTDLVAASRGFTILSATQGQGLGDHDRPTEVSDVYNEHVHVPLAIIGPNIEPRTIMETVSLVDLVPTILELTGFARPQLPMLDGRSLAPLLTGAKIADPGHGTAYIAMIDERTGEPELSAIVRGTWKLVATDQTFELYDLRSDAAEKYNMFGPRPQIAGELRVLLGAKQRLAAQSPFAAPK
jgi:arylsulfatase A-like enzyme